MAVIDIRENPAVDMANARAIGDIFAAIGRAESLRKKKYDMDAMMTNYTEARQQGIENPYQYAVQKVRETPTAPYDMGLKGIWQKIGNAASFGIRQDVSEDITERMLMGGLMQDMRAQDQLYKAQVEGANLGNKGEQQRQEITAKIAPSQISQAESQAKVAEVKAAAAPTEIEQSLEAGAQAITAGSLRNKALEMEVQNMPERDRLDFEAKRNRIAYEKTQMGWAAEDVEMKKELFARERMLEARKLKKDIDNDEYEAEMKLLEIQGKKLENKYMERRGTGLTPNQRVAILKPMQEALAGYTDPKVAEAWMGIAKAAGFGITQNDAGQFVISDTEGAGGGIPQNPTTDGEQTDYSNVPIEDLLKSLMNDPNLR